jgi:predicted kinase
MFQPNDAPRRPRRNSTASTMTDASDTIHVISAGVLLRWNPLTQPHHAQSVAAPTTRATRRVRTEPV